MFDIYFHFISGPYHRRRRRRCRCRRRRHRLPTQIGFESQTFDRKFVQQRNFSFFDSDLSLDEAHDGDCRRDRLIGTWP